MNASTEYKCEIEADDTKNEIDALNDCVKVLDTLVLTQSVPMKDYFKLHTSIHQQYEVSLPNEHE